MSSRAEGTNLTTGRPATTGGVAPVASTLKHITVCIPTYKRPDLLRHLLAKLAAQNTGGLFRFSIVIVDNDHLQSAKPVVLDFSASATIEIKYCVEPRQNIALARNRAVELSNGDFIAFIDDDEEPIKNWLMTLYEVCEERHVDGVLGPVKPRYGNQVPKWVEKGRFYDRPSYPTGTVIDWKKGRTGNVLLRKQVFSAGEQAFRPQFRTGEDQDFFRRMIERGHVFIWCDEALAYEIVPPIRCSRHFMLRRALLRGRSTLEHPTFGLGEIITSMMAVPIYLLALAPALLLGQHKFMLVLVKLFDHLGKLFAIAHINPIKDPYVTH